jgi:hypothetical protein
MTCDKIRELYLKAMSDGFSCQELSNGRISIVLPFLYPDHDNVEIFLKDKGDRIVVTDLGETLRRLDSVGMNYLASGRLTFQVDRIASGFQVNLRDGVMFKEGPHGEASAMLFDLVSACMAVGDLAYSGRTYLPLTFKDAVSKVLDATHLHYDTNSKSRGVISGEEYKIDFKVIAQHRVSLVQTMEAKTKAGVKKWVDATFRMWKDIGTSERVVRRVSLLNDDTPYLKDAHIRILSDCSTVFRWSSEVGKFVASLQNGVPSASE